MNWTVYCMGDLSIYRDVINAVAMVFSSSLFDPSLGAGLVIVAMLISLILFAMPAIMGKPLSPFPLIFVFLLYFGGIVPKTTLQIQDMTTGAVTAVDNVPIIVAAPAAIAAAISKGITDKVETAFTVPSSGTYLSLGAEGFVNPLKILLSFRNPIVAAKASPYFSASVQNFVRDCAVNAPEFDIKALRKSADVVAYFGTLTLSGLTIYYNQANPQGVLTTCADVSVNLANDGSVITASPSADLDQAINLGTPPAAASAGGTASLTSAYNNVTGMIMGNAQTAQQFMVNMIANAPITEGIKCSNAGTPSELQGCQAEITTATAIEQANMDAAANASIFAKTAIPLSNILLALFYAFSPIVLGVALMSAAHGMKIIGGYLMFGAWTQSWMPIAAVMNFMVQEQVQYEISKLGTSGITLENMSLFYNAVSLKVGLASNLLAMTPIISMALLSGSMMALSSVAGKFSQDRVNEKNLAPDSADTKALVSKGNLVDQGTTVQLSSASGAITHDTIGNKANNWSGKTNISNLAAQTESHDRANVHSSSQTLGKEIGNTLSKKRSTTTQTALTEGINSTWAASDKDTYTEADKLVNTLSTGKSWTEQDKKAFKAGIALQLAGNGVGANAEFALMSSKVTKDDLAKAKEFGTSKSRSFSNDKALQFNKQLSTSMSSILGNDSSDTAKSALADTIKAEEALKRSSSLAHQAGQNVERDNATMAAVFMHNSGGIQGAFDTINKNVSPDKQSTFNANLQRAQREAMVALNVRDPKQLGDQTRAEIGLKALADTDMGAYLKALEERQMVSSSVVAAPQMNLTSEQKNIDTNAAGATNNVEGSLPGINKRTEKAAVDAELGSKARGGSGANVAYGNVVAEVARQTVHVEQQQAATGQLGTNEQEREKAQMIADGSKKGELTAAGQGLIDEHGETTWQPVQKVKETVVRDVKNVFSNDK